MTTKTTGISGITRAAVKKVMKPAPVNDHDPKQHRNGTKTGCL